MDLPKVNRSERNVHLEPETFTTETCINRTESPIDEFLRYTRSIIVTSQSRAVNENNEVLKYFVISCISSVEYYVRSLMAGCLTLCPQCRTAAANQTLSLGSIDYYHTTQLGFALVENIALSSAQEIKRQTKAIMGIDIKPGSSLEGAVNRFEKLCQVRHAIVHSKGILSGKNVRDLDIDDSSLKKVHLDIWTFQLAVETANNLVRAYNQEIFKTILRRWINKSILTGDWVSDKANFEGLYKLFESKEDLKGGRRAYDSYRAVQRHIKARDQN